MSARHRKPTKPVARRASTLAVTAFLGASAAGALAGATQAAPPAPAAPAAQAKAASPATIIITPEATKLANSVPQADVDTVARDAGVTSAQVRSWLAGLAQERINGGTSAAGALVSKGKDAPQTVLVKPLVADSSNGGLAVRNPFSQGTATAAAFLPGSFAGASAADRGDAADAFSVLGVATATTGSGAKRGTVNCAGALAYAKSSDGGTCLNVLGTFDYRVDAKTGETSLALTDVSRGMNLPAGTAARAVLEQIGAAGIPLPDNAIRDTVRLTFGAKGVTATSDSGFAGLRKGKSRAVDQSSQSAPSTSSVTPVTIPRSTAVHPLEQARRNADRALWDAVDPVAPGLHEEVTRVATDVTKGVEKSVANLLPSALRPGHPKSSKPLAGSGVLPKPKPKPKEAPATTKPGAAAPETKPGQPTPEEQRLRAKQLECTNIQAGATYDPKTDTCLPPTAPSQEGGPTAPAPGTDGGTGAGPDNDGVTTGPSDEGGTGGKPQKKPDEDIPVQIG